jgi:hypothetical protein
MTKALDYVASKNETFDYIIKVRYLKYKYKYMYIHIYVNI